MDFPLYPDLPLELRRQIIKEAATTRMAERLHSDSRISGLAEIDPDWRHVVEGILFSDITIRIPSDLDDFAAKCGPRSGLLKRVTCKFGPWYSSGYPTATVARANLMGAISRLFNIMKDWSRPDKNTFITVCICVAVPNGGTRHEFSLDPSGLASLPEVPVIGKLYAQLGLAHDYQQVVLSHDTITGLHAKLPNLHGVQLALPTATGAELWETVYNTHDNIVATHASKPNLTKLRIFSNITESNWWTSRTDRTTQIDVARSLAPSLSLWKTSLVSLKLDCTIDVPQFLLVAANTVWQNLDRMDLIGVADSTVSAFRLREDQIDACDDLLRGLVVALPGMPALSKLAARFRNAHNDKVAFSFCMDIGAKRSVGRQLWQLAEHSEPRKSPIKACRPVPAEHATAKAQGILPPGNLVTGLQTAVRRERGLELAVFCCTENEPWELYNDSAPCSQWDRESWEWDPLLSDEIDPLIYRIGRFWEMEMLW